MLYHLDPAVEVTGGPWYTDNELDTEFIKLLSRACLQFVKDRVRVLSTLAISTSSLTHELCQSFPRAKRSADNEHGSAPSQALYAISAAPAYPSSQQVQSFLSKSKITETTLSVEHVEMLLNVLVLDGEVERVCLYTHSPVKPQINACILYYRFQRLGRQCGITRHL
jgi:DNA-directed RNA polymerase III subunit RPC6